MGTGKKFTPPITAFKKVKKDINILSTEFGEDIGFWSLIMAINKAFIDQLVQSIRENVPTSAFRMDLTSSGPYFKTSV